jgi:hypothetical protein
LQYSPKLKARAEISEFMGGLMRYA